MSSPPIVMSCDDVQPQQRVDGVLEIAADPGVGFARAMPMCDPPRKWMRLTASIVSGITCSMSPCMSHSKPSRMPTTSMSFELGADGRGADDAVDAGGGAAADEDGKIVHFRAQGLRLRA